MQIAKIVPHIRTRDEGIFDYAIPPEILPMMKIGILVEVPFHGRDIEGIVVDIKRTSPIPNLKNIIKIVDPVPVIDSVHIKLAKWMSNHYLEPFGKTIFENIVPVAKRSVDKNSIPHLKSKEIEKKETKKYLVIDDFHYRLKVYLKAIEKTISRGQQVII
jgi:primosomal protein N' (replication factor Y) (superfamily II helicase)